MTIRKALQTIKGCCIKHTSCDRCPLQGELYCLLEEEIPADWDVEEDIPADWDVEEMLKKRRGDSDE